MRQASEKLDLRTNIEAGESGAQGGFPRAIPSTRTRHYDQPPGVRMPAQRELNGAPVVVLDRGADDVGGQRLDRLEVGLGDCDVDHRDVREQPGTMAKHEVERERTHDDDRLRRTSGVFFVQVRGDSLFVCLTGEGGPIKKLREDLDVPIRRIFNGFPEPAVDLDVGGEQAVVGEEHQDVPGLCCRRRWCDQETARSQEQSEAARRLVQAECRGRAHNREATAPAGSVGGLPLRGELTVTRLHH